MHQTQAITRSGASDLGVRMEFLTTSDWILHQSSSNYIHSQDNWVAAK